MLQELNIFNEDCITGAKKHLKDQVIDLMVCDPPFGINEKTFDKHYKRKKEKILDGYEEAPDNYDEFTLEWMTEAKRVLKNSGSFYVISGHTNLVHILNAAKKLDLVMVNHIIWKFNFGVNTKKKFVTSHYHVILYKKSKDAEITFNLHCRYGASKINPDGKKSLYSDLEDVWVINKEYIQETEGVKINANKLPEALIEKIIRYSSNPKDTVCDFFMGNFTTAVVAKKFGRVPYGFEINKNSFDHQMKRLDEICDGCELEKLPTITDTGPENEGKPLTPEDISDIVKDYKQVKPGLTKREAIDRVGSKFGRGYFSILNLLQEHYPEEKFNVEPIKELKNKKSKRATPDTDMIG